MRCAAIFPGQLSARVGMGRELAQVCPRAAEILVGAELQLGTGLAEALFTGPAHRLREPRFAQTGVTVVGMMAFAALRQRGTTIEAVAGYSLGIFAALAAAGVWSHEGALRVVCRMIELYDEELDGLDGAMGSILGLTHREVEDCCRGASRPGEWVTLGSHNNGSQMIVSGHRAAVLRSLALAEPRALAVRLLEIDWPVHSPYMQPVAERLAAELPSLAPPGHPSMAVYSPLDGARLTSHREACAAAAAQIAAPLRWDLAFTAMRRDGIACFYECGTDGQLCRMSRWLDREAVLQPALEALA
jgi:[acyl-carrier-protein] S-malonyltransferase